MEGIETAGRKSEVFGGLDGRQGLLPEGRQHMTNKGGGVAMNDLLMFFKDTEYPPSPAAPSVFSSGIATLALLKD